MIIKLGIKERVDQERKENVNTNKLYTLYLKRGFRKSLEEPIEPGDVVLVKTTCFKNTEKLYKSKVLVMEVFYYDGEE